MKAMNRFYESIKIAENYAKFRPVYPQKHADVVMNFYRSQQPTNSVTSKPNLMLDVGCGSGQVSQTFQPYFQKIIGCDVSLEQLKQAKERNEFNNLEYIEACAEELPAADKSVDLIISGTAAHWFNLPKFFQECKRVLKPSGCLAVSAYYLPVIYRLKNPDMTLSKIGSMLLENKILQYAFTDRFLPRGLAMCKERYQEIFEAIPFTIKENVNTGSAVYYWSFRDVRGYMYSEDCVYCGIEKKIEELKKSSNIITQEYFYSICPATQFCESLKRIWEIKSESNEEKVIKAQFDFFTILAKP